MTEYRRILLDCAAVEVVRDGARLASHVVAGPVAGEFGAQPTGSEEVVSAALGGDWEFRGIRPSARS
jgi:5-oxopent-3-ene-1,2,5-tricarboxylate decarboxylase / 2-hydroxyhepta-2,4-diene-1,7-dioate isomerase